jgi:hypothetical protein
MIDIVVDPTILIIPPKTPKTTKEMQSTIEPTDSHHNSSEITNSIDPYDETLDTRLKEDVLYTFMSDVLAREASQKSIDIRPIQYYRTLLK